MCWHIRHVGLLTNFVTIGRDLMKSKNQYLLEEVLLLQSYCRKYYVFEA